MLSVRVHAGTRSGRVRVPEVWLHRVLPCEWSQAALAQPRPAVPRLQVAHGGREKGGEVGAGGARSRHGWHKRPAPRAAAKEGCVIPLSLSVPAGGRVTCAESPRVALAGYASVSRYPMAVVMFEGRIFASSDLAREVGVSADAVRLACRKGHIVPTARTVGGEALYDEGAVFEYRALRAAHEPGKAFRLPRQLRLVR